MSGVSNISVKDTQLAADQGLQVSEQVAAVAQSRVEQLSRKIAQATQAAPQKDVRSSLFVSPRGAASKPAARSIFIGEQKQKQKPKAVAASSAPLDKRALRQAQATKRTLEQNRDAAKLSAERPTVDALIEDTVKGHRDRARTAPVILAVAAHKTPEVKKKAERALTPS